METEPVPQLPTFKTARLVLRSCSMAEFDACLVMERDPLVTQFIPGRWRDPAAHRAFLEACIHHPFPPGMGIWSVFTPAGFIGLVFVIPEGLHGPEVEIGWRFLRVAWGQGYATEAARPVLDHALLTLGLKRVVADIDPANAASIGVACKLGFLPAGSVQHEGWMMARYVVEVVAP